MSTKTLRVVELFAGVGGFRLGLESIPLGICRYKTVWANQWEPGTNRQHAAEIYAARFGDEGFNVRDIEEVVKSDVESIPNHDLLVGGFPCQDYSVARMLNNANGLVGSRGSLFWSIHTLIKGKGNKAPKYILLENVDRLLQSPSRQRGRDFAIMLAALSDLGYAVEWRIINAADYGFPQRRRRVFMVGYRHNTEMYEKIKSSVKDGHWLSENGVLADAFPVKPNLRKHEKYQLRAKINAKSTPPRVQDLGTYLFENSGVMIERLAESTQTAPDYNGPMVTLRDVLLNDNEIPPDFFIPKKQLEKWRYLKSSKREKRHSPSGQPYIYVEGPMMFPDPIDRPSRTVVTGEGGSSASRFKHVVKTKSGRYRRLTPLELERLNTFPENHTRVNGITDVRRAFLMGNALVVGLVQRMGESLAKKINP